MGLFSRAFAKSQKPGRQDAQIVKLMTADTGGGFVWDGKIYKSDIIRAVIRPKVKAIGKAVGKHIRRGTDKDGNPTLDVNPEPYISFLLSEPNPYMTGAELQERMAIQLCLNNNAFALVLKDMDGLPTAIYPINAVSAQKKYDDANNLYLEFIFLNGQTYTFPYSDIIHLRSDVISDDVFGEPVADVLTPLMEVVGTVDAGIVKAVKNSGVIRWLLTYATTLRPEDLKRGAKEFAESYLSIDSDTMGVVATDSKAAVKQVEPKDYIPNYALMGSVYSRIYKLFNTNENIVGGCWNEDQWNAYYESEIEPVLSHLANAYTLRLFTRADRAKGNSIAFESFNLATASMNTRLSLVQLVDRGIMSRNEVRSAFNLAPTPGGDEMLLRKDTGVVKESDDEDGKDGDENEDDDS